MKEKQNKISLTRNSAKPKRLSSSPTASMHPALAAAFARGKFAREKMAVAEGGSISCQAAAKLLGVSAASVVRRWRAYRLVGWTEGNVLHIPVWQFNGGKMLKGIEEILQIFQSHDQWRIMLYFLGNRRSLAKERPLDVLRRGESIKVIKHATDYALDNQW
jgi:hypothetical protein